MPRTPHPRPESLLRLFAGDEETVAVRPAVEHLLRGCPGCAGAVARDAGLAPTPPEPRERYEEAIARAAAAVGRRARGLEQEAESSHEFVSLLLRQPRSRQLLLLRNTERGRTWVLVERLLAASFEVRFDDPRKMVAVAELALRVAAGLDPEKYGPHLLTDLQTRAAAELANALRAADRHESSMLALLTAFELYQHGTRDPLLKARLFELASSVFRQRRRLDLAALLLDRALRLHERFGSSHDAGRVLMCWGMLEFQRPDPAKALDLYCRSAHRLELWRDRHLAGQLIQNLLASLVELGRFATARAMIEECRDVFAEFGDRLVDLRLKWTEGRIAAGTGHEVEAEVKFLEVARGLERAELPYDATLVRLDLALLLGRQGRLFELKLLAEEMIEGFRALRLEREAMAAVLVLSEAFQKSPAPLYLISQVRDFLFRLPLDPGLRFEPAPEAASAEA